MGIDWRKVFAEMCFTPWPIRCMATRTALENAVLCRGGASSQGQIQDFEKKGQVSRFNWGNLLPVESVHGGMNTLCSKTKGSVRGTLRH